jgi:hypothetical protein
MKANPITHSEDQAARAKLLEALYEAAKRCVNEPGRYGPSFTTLTACVEGLKRMEERR